MQPETNRDPVVSYDEEMIRGALHRLGRRRYTRLTSGHSSRAAKYRHLLDEALEIDRAEQAVLAVLLLRGDQTPGELKQRTERMQGFAGLDDLQDVLTGMIDRGLVAQLARRPGQKEERFRHRLSEELDEDESAAVAVAPATVVVPPPPRRDERLDKLEREVAELRAGAGRAALRAWGVTDPVRPARSGMPHRYRRAMEWVWIGLIFAVVLLAVLVLARRA